MCIGASDGSLHALVKVKVVKGKRGGERIGEDGHGLSALAL